MNAKNEELLKEIKEIYERQVRQLNSRLDDLKNQIKSEREKLVQYEN